MLRVKKRVDEGKKGGISSSPRKRGPPGEKEPLHIQKEEREQFFIEERPILSNLQERKKIFPNPPNKFE